LHAKWVRKINREHPQRKNGVAAVGKRRSDSAGLTEGKEKGRVNKRKGKLFSSFFKHICRDTCNKFTQQSVKAVHSPPVGCDTCNQTTLSIFFFVFSEISSCTGERQCTKLQKIVG